MIIISYSNKFWMPILGFRDHSEGKWKSSVRLLYFVHSMTKLFEYETILHCFIIKIYIFWFDNSKSRNYFTFLNVTLITMITKGSPSYSIHVSLLTSDVRVLAADTVIQIRLRNKRDNCIVLKCIELALILDTLHSNGL